MTLIKRRIVSPTPSFRIGSEQYDHETCALLYLLKGNKIGGSGGQKDKDLWSNPFAMIKATHDAYPSPRGTFSGDLELKWGWISKDLIKNAEERKDHQYDIDVRNHLRKHGNMPWIKYNGEDVVRLFADSRPFTSDDIISVLEEVFGNSAYSTYPDHTYQVDNHDKQQILIKEHTELGTELITDLQEQHTRFGKDKVNSKYLGYDVHILPSAFFATWQIESELDPEFNVFIETQGKTLKQILESILLARQQGKTIWIAVSSYSGKADRFDFLSMFKDTNVAIHFDEPDYGIHSHLLSNGFALRMFKNLISKKLKGLAKHKQTVKQITDTLPTRTLPIYNGVTGGTGVYKFEYALKESGILDLFKTHRIEKRCYTQQDSEHAKINGDLTLSHICHKVHSVLEIDENDFIANQIDIPEELRLDWDKLWMGGNPSSIKDTIDLFFNPNSHLFVHNVLNQSIDATLDKFTNESVNYNRDDYNNRTCIGVSLITSLGSKERYNLLLDQYGIEKYFNSLGWHVIRCNSQALSDDGWSGKQELNLYFKSQVEQYKTNPDLQEQFPNGFVVLTPNWGYASRSMSLIQLDMSLGLCNNYNPQEFDRDMTNAPRGTNVTLDGKQKLIGNDVRVPFTSHDISADAMIEDYLTTMLDTNTNSTVPKTNPDQWRLCANVMKHIAGSGSSATMLTEHEIDNALNSSQRLFRKIITQPNFTELLNISGIEDILIKLDPVKGKKSKSSLVQDIKKKIQLENKAKKKGLTKPEKDNLRLLKERQRGIVELLIGAGIGLGEAYSDDLFDAVDQIEQSDAVIDFNEYLGITTTEYTKVMSSTDKQGKHIFPITDINRLMGATDE